MKIVGGSFGASGNAYVTEEGTLAVGGATPDEFTAGEIRSATASTRKDRKFSAFSMLLGLVTITVLLTLFFGPIGLVAGVVVSIAGSFRNKTVRLVHVQLEDNRSVELSGNAGDINSIVRLAHRNARKEAVAESEPGQARVPATPVEKVQCNGCPASYPVTEAFCPVCGSAT